MSLHDVPLEEKIRLLNEWKSAVQKDVDEYQALVDAQLEKKQILEEKLTKKLRPIHHRIATFQKFVDSFTNKRNQIDEEIKKLSETE